MASLLFNSCNMTLHFLTAVIKNNWDTIGQDDRHLSAATKWRQQTSKIRGRHGSVLENVSSPIFLSRTMKLLLFFSEMKSSTAFPNLPSLSLRIFHEIYLSIYLICAILENCDSRFNYAWSMKTLGRENRNKSGNSPLPQGIHPVNLQRYDRITLQLPP